MYRSGQFRIADSQVPLLVGWKPEGWPPKRFHASVLTLPDTGLRIEEAISLHPGDVDLDNPLLKVRGKGRKEKRVPFSMECRRHLYKWLQTQR